MHNRNVNGKDRWPKKISAAMNVLVNWKGGRRPLVHKYKSREGVELKNKVNNGGFRGDYYNFGKYGHIVRDCPKPRK